MFSYLHRFHAGCFADVHKHVILLALLSYLKKKDTPFCVLDAYAGEGIYDLFCEESQKNAEYKHGIWRLYEKHEYPLLIQYFITLISEFNNSQQKQFYPGSAAIIANSLRKQDRAIFVEHHPQAISKLKKIFARNSQINIHDRDSLEALKALIPFKEKRGLIFLDPSYEVKTEYNQLANATLNALKHFPNGIFAIWYPLLNAAFHQSMLNRLKEANLKNAWYCEWTPDNTMTQGMIGSGMILINPPWQIDIQISETFTWLNNNLYMQGSYILHPLSG